MEVMLMMSVKEYASDVNLGVGVILKLCDKLGISASSEDDSLDVSEDDDVLEKTTPSKVISTSSKVSSNSVFIKNSNFKIRIFDENGTGIAKKQVQVNFKDKTKNLTTTKNGWAIFKLTAKGTYTISYSFKANGYAPISGSKKITIVGDEKSKLTGSDYVAYVGIKNPYTVTLTTGGIKMPNKKVIFKIKGKTYTRTTNSKGQATLNINLAKGTYTVKYSFKGVTNAKAASGSAKIKVVKGSPTSITWQNAVTFKHMVSTPFILKYRDGHGNPISAKTLVFKINGKTYTKKTDENGNSIRYEEILLKALNLDTGAVMNLNSDFDQMINCVYILELSIN